MIEVSVTNDLAVVETTIQTLVDTEVFQVIADAPPSIVSTVIQTTVLADNDAARVIADSAQGPPGIQGPAGAQGATGPQGPAGPSGGDLHYVHTQGVASASWVVAHNLAKYPSAAVFDSAGSQWEGEITYDSPNQITITFALPFGGVAYIN